jgi:tetratricopeptide (TPR) repeat protein
VLEPGLGAAHLGLAAALEAQGEHSEAISHLQKAAQSSDTTAAQAARDALRSLSPPRPGGP